MNTKDEPKKAAVAGLTGAVIGAGVVAAAAVLSDKKNRDTLMHTVSDITGHVNDSMKQAGKKVDEAKGALKEKMDDGKKEAQKAIAK